MHITEPSQFHNLPKRRSKPVHWGVLAVLCIFVLVSVGIVSVILYNRPLPEPVVSLNPVSTPSASSVALSWPSFGQAALGASQYGVLATHGTITPEPMASVAKVVTAISLVRQKPLTVGSSGPTITLTDDDVALYDNYSAQDGSVVAVTSGERITEYQALQAMLLPSANNMADSLAIWAFGSVSNYTKFANQLLQSEQINQTQVADASGFSAQSTSTAPDLVRIGELAMKEPVIAQIVNQKEATIPVEGTIENVNWALGSDGVVGIKTGNTNEAGGCFLLAVQHEISPGDVITIISATMSAPNLNAAINSSITLLRTALSGFQKQTLIHKGQTFGTVQSEWGSQVLAVAAKDVTVDLWTGDEPVIKPELNSGVINYTAGSQIGQVKLSGQGVNQSTPIILASAISYPTLKWRLFRH